MTNNPTTIMLTEDFRVRDYDANQYVIERRTVVPTGDNAGQTVWAAVAYCGSVQSLPAVARGIVAGERSTEAHRAACSEFDASALPGLLSALPPKTGKKEQGA